jgi:hypothetical protein
MQLADKAVVGQLVLADYIAASRKMMDSGAQTPKSIQELQDGFALLHAALDAVIRMVFIRSHDAGLQLLARRVNATASQTVAKLGQAAAADYVAKMHAWVQRVMDTWAAELVRFRRAGGTAPLLEECVVGCDHAYKFDQHLVALKFELGSTLGRQPGKRSWADSKTVAQQQNQKQQKSRKRSKRGGQRKEAGRRPDDDAEDEDLVDDDSGAADVGGGGGSVWADRPKFTAKGWKQLQAEVKKKYTKHCMFYLLGNCNRGDGCKFLHNTPSDFTAWRTKMCDECEVADQ